MTRDGSRRTDQPFTADAATGSAEGRRVGFLGPRLPTGLSCRFLSCSLEAPETITLGRPTPFFFHVKNRAPTSLTLECASSRSWGWMVDDVPEAGVGRYEPPSKRATLAFGPRERRTFVGRWDGQVLDSTGERDRWAPAVGVHTLRVYLAVDQWKSRKVTACTEITVQG